MTAFSKFFGLKSAHTAEVEGCILRAKQSLVDGVSDCLGSAQAANDMKPEDYLGDIESFVHDARLYGFIHDVGEYEVMNDRFISEVFEDLIVGIASFSHIRNNEDARNFMKQLSSDVRRLETVDGFTAPSILSSHYQPDSLLKPGVWYRGEDKVELPVQEIA